MVGSRRVFRWLSQARGVVLEALKGLAGLASASMSYILYIENVDISLALAIS